MKFRLATVMWAFALLASALATFGVFGTPYFLLVISIWAFVAYRNRSRTWAIFLGLMVLCCFAALLVYFQPTRVVDQPHQCRRNMATIAKALRAYESAHGHLPPAYTTGLDGNRLHSWRVLLLPFISESNLYDPIKLDEPWNSPSNRRWWSAMPEVYRCPGDALASRVGVFPPNATHASYYAVVGGKTVWPGDQGLKSSNIPDGAGNTIALVEVYRPARNWMEPLDFPVKEAGKLLSTNSSPGHLHTSVGKLATSVSTSSRHVCFAGGNVLAVRGKMSASQAEGLMTRYGNDNEDWEIVCEEMDPAGTIRLATVYQWKRIYTFTLFVLLALLPLTQLRVKRSIVARLSES